MADEKEDTLAEIGEDVLKKYWGLQLGQLGTAIQSIRRGMEWEHSAVEAETAKQQGRPIPEPEEMGPLIVGDVTIGTTQPTTDPPAMTAQPAPKSNGTMAKLAIGSVAALALTGIGGMGAIALSKLLTPDPTPVVIPDPQPPPVLPAPPPKENRVYLE